ncbi:MAG: O-antigen ligase family protein, partial [Herbinix sp.]|nr:O-antigen ligase family protein [Herbinix sp.]
GYIWSRSIPLLKDTLLLGNGPDTFPIVFPQSDYVGKANNCKTPYTLIEKPHNFYLMIGIQTGIISLISFLVFYLIYLMKSFRIYKNNNFSTLKARIGLGCLVSTLSFMISGFFNDSSLQTTPIFIVLLGLGMDINYKLGKASNV